MIVVEREPPPLYGLGADAFPGSSLPTMPPMPDAGFSDGGFPTGTVVAVGIVFVLLAVGAVAVQSYIALKAGAGAERVANRWIDKKYGK